jgi:hypothetical protein
MRFTVRIVQQVKLVPTIETTIVLLVVFWCSKMENGLILSVLPLSSSSMFYSWDQINLSFFQSQLWGVSGHQGVKLNIRI